MSTTSFAPRRRSAWAGLLLALALVGGGASAAHAVNITSTGAGGNWSATATWSPAQVPTSSDNVTIANGTTVTIDPSAGANCATLTVGQGTSGILVFLASAARTLTVVGDVTISAGGTFQTPTSGSTVTTHSLSLGGNLTNNGTLDFSTNANAAGAAITFTGAASNTFSGTGATTDIRTLTVNKGTSANNVLELMPSAFTVQGTTTDGTPSAWLTLSNGTLKISGSFTGTHRTFGAAAWTIPATAGLWLNNAAYTVAGQNGSPTNNGTIRVTQGTFNVGTTSGNSIAAGAGAIFTIEGGAMNVAGRLLTANAVTWNQSAGTVSVSTVGNAATLSGAFDLSSTTTSFTMSGGSIVVVQANTTNQTKVDYRVSASAPAITGGTLQIGSAATATNFVFQIAGAMPNLVVDNTTNAKTATIFTATPASSALDVTVNNNASLLLNAFPLTARNVTVGTGATLNLNATTLTVNGTSVTNNGTMTGTSAGSVLNFVNESSPQTYGGTGSFSSPLDGLTVDSPSGLTLGATSPVIPVLNARLLRGTVTNSNRLTLGTGGVAAVQTVMGKVGLATAGGAYDVAPTFNLGTGAYTVNYQAEGGARSTGFEIPATRTVANLTLNNANGLTLAGGNLTVTGALTLTSGTVTTGASVLAIGAAGSVARTSGHVIGNLKKNVATGSNVARTFEVGTGSDYTPVALTFASVTGAGDVTATSVAGDHPAIATSGLNPAKDVNRSWTVTNSAVAFTTAGAIFTFVPADVDGGSNTAAFGVRRYNAPNWSFATPGTRTATSTQATGLTAFGDFAVGEVAATHAIAASAGANGTISPSGTVTVNDGANQTFTMTPASACFRVQDVVVDGVSVGAVPSYTFTSVTLDHTIAVTFTNTFTITASAAAHGTISPAGAVAVTGCTDQTFTITPDANHHILDVLVDGVSVGPVASYTFTNVTAAHTIAASFAIDNILSVASGNWSAPATWSDGLVPTAADTVVIANGTSVTIDVAAVCYRLVVGQGVSGTLQYEATTARTLTVGSTVTIAAGGTFQSAATGTQTGHVLSLPGNLTNNGTLDFSTNSNTAGAGITFTGASSATFAGTGATTDLRALTINKGGSAANVVELMPGAFTAQGSTTDVAGSAFLTLTSGTLKISGTFTGTHRTFATAAYTIPATGALWLNNPNYTIAAQNGAPVNNGLLRITQGTMNVGSTANNEMSWGAGAQFTIEGGTLSFGGRLRSANAVVWNQSGGTVNVTTVGNSTSSAAGFEMTSATSSFTMSAGTIALVQASTATTKRDYNVTAGTSNISGGTLQIGTAASAAASNFQIAGLMPDLVVDNTTNPKTATLFGSAPASTVPNVTIATGSTLNLNGFTLSVTGGGVTNNGTLTGTTAGSTLAFTGAAAQSWGGAGAVTSGLANLTIDAPAGVTLGSGISSIPVLAVNLARGVVTNSSKLTLGNGGASTSQTTIGKVGLTGTGGSYDVAPGFNTGTGGYSVSYLPEGAARATGFEIPSGRSIRNLTINNANGLTVAGGNLTATGVLTLTSGNVTTGASVLALTSTGSVSRTSGHVIGNLRKNVATGSGVARTFEIGTGTDYTPAALSFASVTGAGDVTATSVTGDHPSLAGSTINPTRSVNRSWTLTNAGVAFTTCDATFNFVAGDVDPGALTANFVVARYNGTSWAQAGTGTRTATSTQGTGLTAFGDFAVGENSHVVTASAGAGGAISPAGAVVVQHGADQTFTFTPNACFRVLDVLVDGVSVGAPPSWTFTNVTANHTIAVSFVNTFTITATAGAHGSIAPAGAVEVPCGTNQTFTITPDPDWHVADVLVDGVSVGAVPSYTFTSVSALHTIAASFVIDNNPPVIADVPATATVPELAPYTFTATATDVETPGALTFSLVGAPAGATIDPGTGVFDWTPSEAEGPGSYPFAVRVSDGQWSDDAPITITVTEVVVAPVLSAVPDSVTIPESAPYTFTAIATDADLPAETETFSLIGAPTGAAIGALTGVFTWTPAETQGPGVYSFTVRVSDGTFDVDAPITITVDDVNVAPVVSGVPAAVTILELAPYTFTATATDADVPVQTLVFSLVDAPDGAAIDGSTGVFTWTPTADQPGLHAFFVRVTDGVTSTDAPISITVGVTPITDLVATTILSGNDADGTAQILLTWSDLPPGHTVEVFRAPFGGYPKYDDDGGVEPAAPSYPPGAPWVATAVTASGTPDEPATRDFWYYVAFVHGGTGVSAVSNRTSGSLDYFLGDVTDGVTAGQGDNLVNTPDLSLLGAHYGIEGEEVAPFAYLDVGPTTDYGMDSRPTSDGILDFEDLIVFAINVDAVSAPQGAPLAAHAPRPAPAAVGNSLLTVDAGATAVVGDTIRCPITLRSAGAVKGLSLQLAWDAQRVRPLGIEPGALAKRAGAVLLSPKPGAVDAAFLGTRGLDAEGVLAVVSFVTLDAGDPGIRVAVSDPRDAGNHKLEIPVNVQTPVVLPRTTALALAAPNPFRARTTLAFQLARAERVEIGIYSVDGRHVRTLVREWRAPGRYEAVWDGCDDGGRKVGAGVYYARFTAGSKELMRPVVFLR